MTPNVRALGLRTERQRAAAAWAMNAYGVEGFGAEVDLSHWPAGIYVDGALSPVEFECLYVLLVALNGTPSALDS